MRILLLYPPPWKVPAPGEEPDRLGEGPHKGWKPEERFGGDEMIVPYGLLSLAAQAKRAGHDVDVLNIYAFAWRDVTELIRRLPADLYGLSCFTSNRRGTLSLSRLIREMHPQAYILVGGPHASALPREMLERCEAIDGIVIGEGEATFMELVERLEQGKVTGGISGMAWRTDHEVEVGPPRKRIDDLDSLSSPYDYYEGNCVLSTRGCPGNCTFCGSPATWGKKVRCHSAEYILDMIERMIKVHKKKFIAIKDDTFTFNRKRVLEICDGIVKRDLNFLWSCDTRADALDEEVLFAMRKAGCQRISMGVESGSPEILKTINKRITPEKVLVATQMAKKFGFQIRYYMIAGNRGESGETLRASVDFIIAARPNQFLFYFLTIFPGTKEFEIAERAGLASREMFFSKDFPYFIHPLPKEDSYQLSEIVDWIYAHPGWRDFWDYSITERETILELFPGLHAADMDLGGAHYQAGNLGEAEGCVRRAIEMGYTLPGVGYNYLACIAASHGDFEGAVDYLRKAKRLGIHSVVERNLKSLRAWLISGGLQSGKRPNLIANHDFEVSHKLKQPILPGPIKAAGYCLSQNDVEMIENDLERIDYSNKNISDSKTIKIFTCSISSKSEVFQFRFSLDLKQFSQKTMWDYFSKGRLYEPETSQFFLKVLTDGDCFVDIGAHIGYFSLLAATLVGTKGKIVSFEPEDSNYSHLKKNIALNDFKHVQVVNRALGSENKQKQFFINLDNDGGHALWDVGLHPFNTKSRANRLIKNVKVVTLDSIFENEQLNNVKLIKVDAEGSELDIMRGGANIILEYDVPYIICEINEFALQQMGTGEKELRKFMGRLGYDVYLITHKEPHIVKLPPGQCVESSYVTNLLFSKGEDPREISTLS